MAEGAPLLREYGLNTHRGFESLSLRQIYKSRYSLLLQAARIINKAPVAQLDDVQDAQVSRQAGGRERLEYGNSKSCMIVVIELSKYQF